MNEYIDAALLSNVIILKLVVYRERENNKMYEILNRAILLYR